MTPTTCDESLLFLMETNTADFIRTARYHATTLLDSWALDVQAKIEVTAAVPACSQYHREQCHLLNRIQNLKEKFLGSN